MRAPVVVVIIVLGLSGVATAQIRNFSGTWIATSDAAPGMQAAPTPIYGPRFALRDEGNRLQVVRIIRDTTYANSFTLDGTEARFRVPGGLCQGDTGSIETAVREADAIVTTLVGVFAPGSGEVLKRNVRRVFRLASPDTLVVESQITVKGESRPVATLYKRSTETLTVPDVPANKVTATIGQVTWISGVWSGTRGQTTVEERWTPTSGGSMLATARTMQGGVMSSFEFLCIAERDGGLVYSAMPNGRAPATHFTLTSITADAATFENSSHDFPRMIRYTKSADGSLETTIAGEGGKNAQTFVLRRGQ